MVNFGSVLAQVNFGTNSASILGIFLAVSGAALYFLRTVRPELSRDQDIFFAAVGLLCGFILIFQGWRLDPILQFGQLLLVGSTVFFAVESIRLRAIATQQAKRNTPIVDEEREVSRNYSYSRRGYEAEVETDLEPLPYEEEEPPVRPRIRGTRETRTSREDSYQEGQHRNSQRRTSRDRTETGEQRRSPSSKRPPNRLSSNNYGGNSTSYPRQSDDWESPRSSVRKSSRRSNSDPATDSRDPDVTPRSKRRRPPTDLDSQIGGDDDAIPTEYVPYQPLEKPNDQRDNSTDVDEDFL